MVLTTECTETGLGGFEGKTGLEGLGGAADFAAGGEGIYKE